MEFSLALIDLHRRCPLDNNSLPQLIVSTELAGTPLVCHHPFLMKKQIRLGRCGQPRWTIALMQRFPQRNACLTQNASQIAKGDHESGSGLVMGAQEPGSFLGPGPASD